MASIVTSGWTVVALSGAAVGQEYVYTATPSPGGTMQIQWSADGVSWTWMADVPASGVRMAYVPAAAVQIRAIGVGAGGTLVAVVDPGFVMALTPGQVVAAQALVAGAVFIPAGLASASANSTVINAALTAARVAGGGTVAVIGSGVCYHDRTITPGSYTKFVTLGCVLRLAPGSSCNQVRNYGAQNAVNRINFISVAAGFMTVVEKGHSREIGNQVYIENCQGNTTPNGVQTITESGTNGSGFRYWKVAVASNAALTNDIYTSVFISNYIPLAGSAFSRTAVSATAAVTIAAPGVVSVTGHLLSRADPVYFTTTGALPTGLVAGTVYYVLSVLSANTVTLSINFQLCHWLDRQPNNSIILLHEKPEDLAGRSLLLASSYDAYVHSGQLVPIRTWMSDTSVADLRSFLRLCKNVNGIRL